MSEQFGRLILTGILAALGLFVVYLRKRRPCSEQDIASLPSILPFVNAWHFFNARHDFIRDGFSKVKQNMFRFYVNQNQVVVMKGEAARKYFYGDKYLSSREGYSILMGGVPHVEDIQVATESEFNLSWFQKNVTHLFRKDRLAELIPELFSDLERQMKAWPETGRLNPFTDVYALVFQLTCRAATCCEIADDPAQVQKLARLYWIVEQGSNPKAMIFPWMPNRAVKEKQRAVQELYGMLSSIINKRKESGGRHLDAFQVLIDADQPTADIIQFTFGVLFAGVVNTGINACWALLFLAAAPEWKAKAVEEVSQFVRKYASSGSGSLVSRLAQAPSQAWEDEMPVLELIIRETIRLMSRGAALRRNVKETIVIDNKMVERGAFLAHAPATVHFDPDVYTNPEKFDPDRFSKGREEDKKVGWGFVGWGVGRHPCLGQRFAQLEIKAILSLFLMGFEYEHVNAAGNPACVSAADIDRNNLFQARPKNDDLYIKYKKVAL